MVAPEVYPKLLMPDPQKTLNTPKPSTSNPNHNSAGPVNFRSLTLEGAELLSCVSQEVL